jgi:hypothetical protein
MTAPADSGRHQEDVMARRRYQRGQLSLRGKEKLWVARWREDVIRLDGSIHRVRKCEVIGTLKEFKTRRLAERELEQRLSEVNSLNYTPRPTATFAQFAAKWEKDVLTLHKPSTGSADRSRIRKPLSGPIPPLLGSSTALQGSYALMVWTPPALGNTTGPSMCGLWFDEWLEQIPNSAEKPAVTFHYAEPSARAPQSLLLAVATAEVENWSARVVRDTVLEAVALAKIRTVDPQTLELGGKVGQLLPALFSGFGRFTISSGIPWLPTSINPIGS